MGKAAKNNARASGKQAAAKTIIRACLVVCLILLVFFSGFSMVVYDTGFYEKEYEKNLVYEEIGEDVVLSVTGNLLGYFKGDNELVCGFFSEREVLHLKDVKDLIQKTFVTYYVFLFASGALLVLLWLADRKGFAKSLEKTLIYSGCGVLMIMITAVLSSSRFEWMFVKFHQLLFDNNLWMLSSSDNLIIMYPEQFWIDISARILLNSLMIVFSMFAIAGVLCFFRAKTVSK